MDKKYLWRIAGYIALALAAVILMVDIAYQLGGSLVSSVETLSVSTVREDQTISADGYIVRTEVPLSFAAEGILSYTVSDGTRVSAGTKVAEVYGNGENQAENLDRLNELVSRRQLLDQAIAQKGSYSSSAIDREITRLRQEIDRMTSTGNVSGITPLTDALQVMLYIRELNVGNDLSALQTKLDDEITALKETVGGALTAVRSNRSGYYFSACDGYESYLTVEEALSASADELRALLHREQAPTDFTATAGKIVTDYRWCVVLEVPFTAAQTLKEGKEYALILSELDGVKQTMRLERLVLEYGSETTMLVFSATEMPAGFGYTRYQSVSIVLSETDGYRIPVSALRRLNGITGVYVLRGSVVEFREIAPVLLSDGAVLVSATGEPTGEYPMLGIYDVVIVRGKELYVGKIVDQ